ncbi:MAG: CRISPR-associated protein Cas5 [Spirosomaceae bacterium]|jgi:CRISPR-associated protein Cas5 subtype I-B|nr:CRISPR-associated protein Cas5 [Spirosomataceae bacterium]
MKAIQLTITGNWGHFRKAETNNNPLSHDLITKTALIGLIGAVIGKERKEMKPLFPQLSEDFKYGVQVQNAVQKQSWGFTFRSIGSQSPSPKQMELLRSPAYLVTIGLFNARSGAIFDEFVRCIKNSLAVYTPVLGLHNCPANLSYSAEGLLTVHEGAFETLGFITAQHKPKGFKRLGFDKVPTFQNDDFWNLPERYEQVIYPSENQTLRAEGQYYQFNHQSHWFLI